jgi:biopolymer transport protein ExbD/biopolymer transport protein TolR
MGTRVAGWRKRVSSAGVLPDMNVTPLVDVVLVLLIIFMVVAPQLEKDVQVDLPGIFNPDPEVEGVVDPIKVSVAKANEFHVENQTYDLDGVVDYLTEQHALDPYRRLVLRGDAKLKYGQVREFMARVQSVGFPGVNFMVGEKHKEGTRATTEFKDEQPAPAGTEG